MPADTEFSLHGKTAIVTGAAGLLGREHCRALTEHGASVVAVDANLDGCESLARELAAAGAHVLAVRADIADEASVAEVRDRALHTFGAIDVLVNNAAIDDKVEGRRASAEDDRIERYDLSRWRRAIDVNVTGTFVACKVLGAVMAANGGGSIVNVASTYGVVAPDPALYVRPDGTRLLYKSPAYSASKGAVLALTRHLAAYWGPMGVRVNALSPGGVANGQEEWFVERYAARTPLARMANKDDYRGALVFLASGASAYMTGANLVVDGGWTAW